MTTKKDSERLARADTKFYGSFPDMMRQDCQCLQRDVKDLISEKRNLEGLLKEAESLIDSVYATHEEIFCRCGTCFFCLRGDFYNKVYKALEDK